MEKIHNLTGINSQPPTYMNHPEKTTPGKLIMHSIAYSTDNCSKEIQFSVEGKSLNYGEEVI